MPAGAGAGRRDRHGGAGLVPGRVHRRPGLLAPTRTTAPRAWLIHQTGITKGAAVGHTAWAERAAGRTRGVRGAGRRAGVGVRWAGSICLWTDKLPEEHRDDADDELLVAAAAAGLGLADLAALFAEMYERARSGTCPMRTRTGSSPTGRCGWPPRSAAPGSLHGDLTPECAAVVAAVLDALSAPAGKEDDRTQEQRYHDALAEAMRGWSRPACCRSGPGSRSRPGRTSPWPTCSGSTATRPCRSEWTAQVRARWAARRAPPSETGANDGAWLDGDAAEAIACDAAMAPIVTGDVNVDALEDLVRLCVELDRLRRDGDGPGRAGHHRGLGRARAGGHRQGRRPAVRPGRAGELPAPPAARRPAGRAEPAAGHRVRRDDPGGDPQRGAAAGPALPVGRRLQPARRGLRGAPHQAQGQRRQDLASRTASCCARSTTRS